VSVSPYAAFGNNPILNTDPLGDTLSNPQLLGAAKIAGSEISDAIKNNRGFFVAGTNGRLLGAAEKYIKDNNLNLGDASDFISQVAAYHDGLASVAMKSSSEFAQLNSAVINNDKLTAYQALNLTIGYIYNSDAQLRSILNISANVAVGEAAGGVGIGVGRGPIGPRINSNLAQSLVDAGTTRVGQWMSPGEFEQFNQTGIIPRSNALIKGPAGYERQASRGDFYVEFDVKTTLLRNKESNGNGWVLIRSKNQMEIKLAAQKGQKLAAPVGTNIKFIKSKQ
jgi:hypothetical protein